MNNPAEDKHSGRGRRDGKPGTGVGLRGWAPVGVAVEDRKLLPQIGEFLVEPGHFLLIGFDVVLLGDIDRLFDDRIVVLEFRKMKFQILCVEPLGSQYSVSFPCWV